MPYLDTEKVDEKTRVKLEAKKSWHLLEVREK